MTDHINFSHNKYNGSSGMSFNVLHWVVIYRKTTDLHCCRVIDSL